VTNSKVTKKQTGKARKPKPLTARTSLVGTRTTLTIARPVIMTPSANAEVPAATDLHVVVNVNIASEDYVLELTDVTGSPPYPPPYTQTGTPNASSQVIADIPGAQLQPNRTYELRVYIDPAFGPTPPNLDHVINITTGG
jgi:hypothetical protein